MKTGKMKMNKPIKAIRKPKNKSKPKHKKKDKLNVKLTNQKWRRWSQGDPLALTEEFDQEHKEEILTYAMITVRMKSNKKTLFLIWMAFPAMNNYQV